MSGLRPAAPYPAAVELRCWTLDAFGELRRLRAALREAIENNAAEVDDLFDKMAVVATELATNALRHGLPPTEVRLLRYDHRLILDVADYDVGTLPEVDDSRPLGAGGLGLQLTKTFAIDTGWYTTETTKHVWASFPG
ncbi:ATP-binding protein [Actinoplanes sp. URMC 104]|uniref:ATP-binding protein n=1 Tax=Actinoplanes sp. URMC 104 TaxID=3423409 RepID=UPI003F1C1A3A